jgi:hypothetical protein
MSEKKYVAEFSEKTVGILCDDKGLSPLLRELLRQKSWDSVITERDLHSLRTLRLSNKIDMFMIADSPTLPAVESMRVLFKDSRCRLTPTLIFTGHQSTADQLIYERIFQTVPCPKPVTYESFNSCMERLLNRWNQPAMVVLRKIAAIPDEQNLDRKIEILDKLLVEPNAMPLALSARTELLLSKNLPTEAEEKLLSLCKTTPVNPVTLAICAWFYISVKMPVHAMRFLEKLKTLASSSVLLNLDLASAQIASGEITKALNTLHEWTCKNPGNETFEECLAKLLVADGKHDSAEYYGVKRTTLQKCSESWAALELKDVDQTPILKREQNAS